MKKKSKIFLLIFAIILLISLNYTFLDKELSDFLGDSKITSGVILTTDPKIVCSKNYSASVRDVSLELKKEIYRENGLSFPQPSGTVELDHIIPLELGGGNGIRNLQIEMRDPRPGYLEKDKVENYLHKRVCSGSMNLEEAQNQIVTNWTAIYFKLSNKS
jgi:hypothetical protein